MEIHDTHVPDDLFSQFTAHMPECCVELVVDHDGGVLLARRTNPPGKGEWFWPGGRLYKGEELDHAAHRVAREELGIDVELGDRLGVYSHFWKFSAVQGAPGRQRSTSSTAPPPSRTTRRSRSTISTTATASYDNRTTTSTSTSGGTSRTGSSLFRWRTESDR